MSLHQSRDNPNPKSILAVSCISTLCTYYIGQDVPCLTQALSSLMWQLWHPILSMLYLEHSSSSYVPFLSFTPLHSTFDSSGLWSCWNIVQTGLLRLNLDMRLWLQLMCCAHSQRKVPRFQDLRVETRMWVENMKRQNSGEKCYVPYHRLNSISISARDTPQMHIWSSSLPVICSLCLSGQFPYWSGSSGTLLYVKTPLPYLRYFTFQRTPLNTCILIQHLGVWPCTEKIPYVQFALPHICIIHPHATLIIPHVISKIFHMLIALHYLLCFILSVYKLWVPILYFLSFEYQI